MGKYAAVLSMEKSTTEAEIADKLEHMYYLQEDSHLLRVEIEDLKKQYNARVPQLAHKKADLSEKQLEMLETKQDFDRLWWKNNSIRFAVDHMNYLVNTPDNQKSFGLPGTTLQYVRNLVKVRSCTTILLNSSF